MRTWNMRLKGNEKARYDVFLVSWVGREAEQARAHKRSNRLESLRLKSQVGLLFWSHCGLAAGTDTQEEAFNEKSVTKFALNVLKCSN